MTNTNLSIVVPVYNEPQNIAKTLAQIKKLVNYEHEVIVVYDRDSDTTVPILTKLGKKYKNLLPVKNEIAIGPSGAIRTGLKKAKNDFVLVTMADLCDDLKQVDEMIEIARNKGAAIVCPSRYIKGGKQELNAPFKVGFPKTAGLLLNAITGINTHDPTNSYKLYSKKLLKKIHLKSTVSFSVTLEITVKTFLLGEKIAEIPTVWKDRQHGKTNFRLVQSLVAYSPWFVMALFRNRVFNLSHFVSWLI